MAKNYAIPRNQLLVDETGTYHKSWNKRLRIALVYPNLYHVGMSNLGFQTVYRLLNQMEDVVCERFFLSDPRAKGSNVSLETGRALGSFDIIAFSISFENDYPNILTILEHARLPLLARHRGTPYPVILAGGVACFLNPEPIAEFFDLFLLGEAEMHLSAFIRSYDAHRNRNEFLIESACEIPGVYVPSLFAITYHPDGTLKHFVSKVPGIPLRIRRVSAGNLSQFNTCSKVTTPHTTFDQTFLIEVSRGCPHGCRFCSAGFIYRPPRFRSLSQLQDSLVEAQKYTHRIGLVGAAISDLPDINALCQIAKSHKIRVSFSSLRADALTPDLVSTLKASGVKTATIAPEAGSQRMRDVINKGISEAQLLSATDTLVTSGIPNLKLYFMIGLPTETTEDIKEIVALCKRIKSCFLEASRPRGKIGTITVSINPFIPKPFTPFQWAPMEKISVLRRKLILIRKGLKGISNLNIQSKSMRHADMQALFARGDRRVAKILLQLHHNRGNWPQTMKKMVNPSSEFYLSRQRPEMEQFPWDFIDQGVKKEFLLAEYRRAMQGKLSPPCPIKFCNVCGACSQQ